MARNIMKWYQLPGLILVGAFEPGGAGEMGEGGLELLYIYSSNKLSDLVPLKNGL